MSSYDEIPNELIEYVEVRINGYFVKKSSKTGRIIFGKFNSVKEACAAAFILYRNDWKLMNVVNNPLVEYDDEFWIFKVEENKLVFDNKFNEYESAVEYLEINSRCNDYYNDIFRNSLKKNSYNEDGKSFKNEDSNVKRETQHIFENCGKFLVKKSKRKNSTCYGEFESIEEAIVARQILLDSNWVITNEYEVSFYNDFYWIFEVSEGILTFKGKFQSYEDVLDIINPPITQNEEFINPFINSAENHFKERDTGSKLNFSPNHFKERDTGSKLNFSPNHFKERDTGSKLNFSPNHFKERDTGSKLNFSPSYFKRKNNIESDKGNKKIWSPKLHNNLKIRKIRIFVERCGDNVDDLFSILDFKFYGDYIQCIVDGEEINRDNECAANISNFPEFPLIYDILNVNEWDLSKINNSSSIHFYNSSFYKVHVVKNTIVFGKFVSYKAAENTLLIYKGRPLDSINHTKLGIDKVNIYYEFTKFQGGVFYKTFPLESLEEVKAIRDILIHSNWNFDIFNKYDLFYLNGMYWDLKCSNNVIRLNSKMNYLTFIK